MSDRGSNNRLKNFPISFYAIALGLIGYTLALLKAETVLNLTHCYHYFLYFTIFIFGVISIMYLSKIILFPQELRKELDHPVKLNFFPILAKIFLVASIIFLSIDMGTSKVLWIIGAVLQFAFSIIVLSIWFRHTKFQYHHLNPAWFIPIVGNVIVPIAGVQHGFFEVSWFFFSMGLFMWISLFVIVLNRIIFHEPIHEKLIPTFFILFAPPAIAFIAYVKLVGALDPFARILYYISFFLLVFIFCQARMFSKIKFYLSWWAYSFPMSAVAIATMLMYDKTGFLFFRLASIVLLSILTMIIVYLGVRTTKAVFNKELCIEE